MCNTRCGLVSAPTPHNHGQRSCGSAIVPGSDLNTRCIADGVVERVCGCCGGHPPTGGRGTAPGDSPRDGGPSEHLKGGCGWLLLLAVVVVVVVPQCGEVGGATEKSGQPANANASCDATNEVKLIGQ